MIEENSVKTGSVWLHKRTQNKYRVIFKGEMKFNEEWHACVVYCPVDSPFSSSLGFFGIIRLVWQVFKGRRSIWVREASVFERRFTQLHWTEL